MERAQTLSQQERQRLLQAARRTIQVHLERGVKPVIDDASGTLLEPRGAFVTLHKGGRLRGCIGTFESSAPLVETVQRMAVSASTADPRFPAVIPEEVEELRLEISVLSPLQKADPEEVVVGRHGVCISQGYQRGVLLPQVATEQGWDRQTFLEHTCLKAGLPRSAWRDADTVVEVFSAEVFGEEDAV